MRTSKIRERKIYEDRFSTRPGTRSLPRRATTSAELIIHFAHAELQTAGTLWA